MLQIDNISSGTSLLKITRNASTPLKTVTSTPLTFGLESNVARRYISTDSIIDKAVAKYEKTGRGIKYADLLNIGLAKHKKQAQDTLKYQLRKGNLFTLRDKRPQEYFPSKIKAKVLEKIGTRNAHIDPTGVPLFLDHSMFKSPLSRCNGYLAIATLEGFVLPLLPEAPLSIHNMHLKTHIPSECYEELKLPAHSRNRGKSRTEIIGATRVVYTIYGKGTVDVQVGCSHNPYKLENETDRARLLTYLGQIRDRLAGLLHDPHERIVPDVMEWYLTECDLNRDVRISHFLHFSALKVQVKHMNHFFSIYIKALGKDSYCRFEERMHFKDKPTIEAINEILNPDEKVLKQMEELTSKIDLLTRSIQSRD